MSIESDAASQVASIYTDGLKFVGQLVLKIGETLLELSGVGAKALANHLIKAWHQEDKVGKLRLENLVKRVAKEEKTLQLFGTNIPTKEKFEAVQADLERYGLSYSVIEKDTIPIKKKDRDPNTNYYEFMVCAEDAPILNHIIERHGLNLIQEETNEQDFVKEEKTSKSEVSSLNADEQEHSNADDFIDDVFNGKSKSKAEDITLNDDEYEASNSEIFLDEVLNKEKTKDSSLDKKDDVDYIAESYVDDYYNGKNKKLSDELEKDVIEVTTAEAFVNNVLDENKGKAPTKSSEKKGQSGLKSLNEKTADKPSLKEGLSSYNKKNTNTKSSFTKKAPTLPKKEFNGKG